MLKDYLILTLIHRRLSKTFFLLLLIILHVLLFLPQDCTKNDFNPNFPLPTTKKNLDRSYACGSCNIYQELYMRLVSRALSWIK